MAISKNEIQKKIGEHKFNWKKVFYVTKKLKN